MHFLTSRENDMHYTHCEAYNNLYKEENGVWQVAVPDIYTIHNAHWRLSGRNKGAQLCHDGHQGNLSNVGALATHVRPGDDHGSFAVPLRTAIYRMNTRILEEEKHMQMLMLWLIAWVSEIKRDGAQRSGLFQLSGQKKRRKLEETQLSYYHLVQAEKKNTYSIVQMLRSGCFFSNIEQYLVFFLKEIA